MNETTTITCTGEAHSNPYIDNCMVCAPEWGQITVCAECKHRPGQHAGDGCHGAKNEDDMASERCDCKSTFHRKGGKRVKKFAIETRGGRIVHEADLKENERPSRDEAIHYSSMALNSGEAIRNVRRHLREKFEKHTKSCSRTDCWMDSASISTRGTTGFGGCYDRAKLAKKQQR